MLIERGGALARRVLERLNCGGLARTAAFWRLRQPARALTTSITAATLLRVSMRSLLSFSAILLHQRTFQSVPALAFLAVARASRAGAVYARNRPTRPATARRSIFSSVSFPTGGFPSGTFSFDTQNLLSAAEQILWKATGATSLLDHDLTCAAIY